MFELFIFIEKEWDVGVKVISEGWEKIFESPCKESCIETLKESCEDQQNELLDKLWEKSSEDIL